MRCGGRMPRKLSSPSAQYAEPWRIFQHTFRRIFATSKNLYPCENFSVFEWEKKKIWENVGRWLTGSKLPEVICEDGLSRIRKTDNNYCEICNKLS